jgi:glucose-6-phosphate isomerase
MSNAAEFDPGLAITVSPDELAFEYGPRVFGPRPEFRYLDAIRPSLLNPDCDGPDPVYGIAMDFGRDAERSELERRMLLFGAVVYSSGTLGAEPVRSQGHVHAPSPHSGWSAPEVFEIWSGSAIVYGQQSDSEVPGRCVAVYAKPGDKVVMPPGWAHCVINADPQRRMTFAALCDRQYGFDYKGVRARGGLAWFPLVGRAGEIRWQPNPRYAASRLEQHDARTYPELGVSASMALYEQFVCDPESLMFVSDPQRVRNAWPDLIP